MRLSIWWLSCVVLFGCDAVAVPYLKGERKTPPILASQAEPGDTRVWGRDESGPEYCYRVATAADKYSQLYLSWGIVSTVVASGLVIIGTAMGPDTRDDANWAQTNRNTLTIASGGLIGIPAAILLSRSSDMSAASSSASKAMAVDDPEAMARCLDARALVVDARAEQADFSLAALGERVDIKALKELKKDVDADVEKLRAKVDQSAGADKAKAEAELVQTEKLSDAVDKALIDALTPAQAP